MLGFVLRNCKEFKGVSSKIVVFNSLVRSGMEYCRVVWNLYYEVHKKRLEAVQKRFLWHLSWQSRKSKSLPSYRSRLIYFEMLSLEDRRTIIDYLFLHKVINYTIDCSNFLEQVNLNVPYKLARHSRYLPYKSKGSRTKLGHFSTINRIQSQYSKFVRSSQLDVDMSYSHRKFRFLLYKHFRSVIS